MALKPVKCSGDVLPLDQRVLQLAKRLREGQCYVLRDVAQEFGVTPEGVRNAAHRVGVIAYRAGVQGMRVRAVIVNPAHVGGGK
jgi:hypothetical protein